MISSSAKRLRCVILQLVACLSLLCFGAQGNQFEVLQSPWTACTHINESQACYRTRQAVCVRSADNVTAPWYYCTESNLQRPHTVELCPEGSCAQHCAVSEWSAWSECDCEESLYRNRTRDIFIPPRHGGDPCPNLFEQETCPTCIVSLSLDELPRRHTWKVGDWGRCIPLTVWTGCGHGTQNRTVQCVDMEESVVDVSKCLSEKAYLRVLPPTIYKLCSVPCQCVLGEWSSWSECTPLCNTTSPYSIQTRTRPILQEPTGGESCSPTTETRDCPHIQVACPLYTWEASDWSPCQHQAEATCGLGHRTRYTYCIESTDEYSRMVNPTFCTESTQPWYFERCETPCPQQCVVGEWSDWTSCPKTCNLTYINRTRPVLVQPIGDVPPCPHTIERRPCPQLPCVNWVADSFQECFPDTSPCGYGMQSRSVYCGDVEGNEIDYVQCVGVPIGPMPGRTQTCYKPCPNDCVLSDWSDWSECSESCDEIVGNQTRTRTIVAYNSSCPYTEADLIETRACPEPSACENNVYYVVRSSWSECTFQEDALQGGSGDDPNSLIQSPEFGRSSQCGEVGVQNRTSVCMKGDHVVPLSECPFEVNLLEVRRCHLPCESNCEFSDWSEFSECSVTCGRGIKTRARRLLQFPDSLELDCRVEEDGTQLETETCVMPSCSTSSSYAWHAGEWSNCNVFSNVLSQHSHASHNDRTNTHTSTTTTTAADACGTGFKNRTVWCVNMESSFIVSSDHCLSLDEPKPESLTSCTSRCRDRCVLTEWSEFGACDSEGGNRSRSREIVPFINFEHWTSCCPELSTLSTVESVHCQHTNFQPYVFTNSDWGSCIIESPYETCGNGDEFRTVECINLMTANFDTVNEEFCLSAGKTPKSTQQFCNIKCQQDCIQSEWEWGPCSTTCGQGVRRRIRHIDTHPLERGRECGHSEEFDVCMNEPCPYAEYVPGNYGSCEFINSSTVCGNGVRTREPVCLVNGLQRPRAECDRLGASVSFELNETCVLSCPGECVVSEWSAWPLCNTGCSNGICQRQRRRSKLRVGTDCPMLREFQTCEQEMPKYYWNVSEWLNCTVVDDEPQSRDIYCGNGTQRRIVECVIAETRQPVHDRLCEGIDKPSNLQSCTVLCPVDCQVGVFSNWSPPCPSRCEDGPEQQTRHRDRLVRPQNGGRECPPLEEVRPCPRADCDKFEFTRHPTYCSADYTPGGQCGRGVLTEPYSCLRNGLNVDVELCFEAYVDGIPVDGLNGLFDLSSPTQCTLECPSEPSCEFDEWTSSSQCMATCTEVERGFNFRQRYLVSSIDRHTETCLTMQYQQNDCTLNPGDGGLNSDLFNTTASTPSESNCLDVSWRVLPWLPNNTREVWCESNEGTRLTSGCPLSTMPRTVNVACTSDHCTPNAKCSVQSDKCECVDSFEQAGDLCLPIEGCFDDSHCLFEHTVCVGSRCVCEDGYELENENCISTLPPVNTTTVSMSTDDNDTSTMDTVTTVIPPDTMTTQTTEGPPSPTVEEPNPSSFGILPIALISTLPLVVVIVTVFVLILVTYRCRQQLEKKHREEIEEVKQQRNTISISSPSPTHLAAEEVSSRSRSRMGAESASSGFVDDTENVWGKFGMAGKTFLGSQRIDGQDIDEAAFPANNNSDVFPPPSPSHGMYPVPVPGPTIPSFDRGRMPSETSHHAYQVQMGAPFITDGDATTTDAYTTDDGSIVTTSVPPSSVGSPNIPRKGAAMHMITPEHLHHTRTESQGTYVEMNPHPVYSEVRRSGRLLRHDRERSHDWERRSHDRSHEYIDDQRSLSPTSPRHDQPFSYPPSRNTHYAIHHHQEHDQPYYHHHHRGDIRDTKAKISAGLDPSLIQAVSQMQDGHHTPSAASVASSSGSRRSHRRRSGRRRRQYSNPNTYHMTYHPPSRSRHRDEYSRHHSEGDNAYYSTSDHENYHPPPPDHVTPNGHAHHHRRHYNDYLEYPPHVQVQPATPNYNTSEQPPLPPLPGTAPPPPHQNGSLVGSQGIYPPQNESTPIPGHHLGVTHPKYSHYDYPRRPQHVDETATYASPHNLNIPMPPDGPHNTNNNHTSPYAFPTSRSEISNASSSTYAPPSIHSDTTSSQPSSPYAVRRQQYPPSPLVLHSNSSNAESTTNTPRTSGEVGTGLHVRFSSEELDSTPVVQQNGDMRIMGSSEEALGFHGQPNHVGVVQ